MSLRIQRKKNYVDKEEYDKQITSIEAKLQDLDRKMDYNNEEFTNRVVELTKIVENMIAFRNEWFKQNANEHMEIIKQLNKLIDKAGLEPIKLT